MGDGLLGLFFTEPVSPIGGRGRSRPRASVIRGAITRDGTEFVTDPRLYLRFEGSSDFHVTVGRLGEQLHLYVSTAALNGDEDRMAEGAYHAIREEAGSLARIGRIRAPGLRFVGGIVPHGKGLRAYISSNEGICSLVSSDGHHWTQEAGIRLANGWDPAVLQLGDGDYLMLYTAAASGRPDAPALVDAGADWETPWDPAAASHGVDSPAEAAANGLTHGPSATEPEHGGKQPDLHWATIGGHHVLLPGPPPLEGPFAPPPDFQNPVDYLAWYNRHGRRSTADDSYDDYCAILPATHSEWPEFKNLFQEVEFDGEAGPWHPSDHPDWEKSRIATRDYLARFEAATRRGGYSGPPAPESSTAEGLTELQSLLLGLVIDHLPGHRVLAKATLADAWRMENGRVSGERMIQAWETVLRGAAHLEQGPTLIEDLVAVAERNLVEETARWALHHEVFSETELRKAFDTLRTLDADVEGPAERLRGEHAFAMDITQYLFSPPDADGRPMPNLERARSIAKEVMENEHALDGIMDMTAEDVEASIESQDAYYREIGAQMRIGYPVVRAADLEHTYESTFRGDPFSEAFRPSWSMYYKLRARQESSRRATQLVYATHIFRAREGRWPATLSEMSDTDATMRTDPFTGTDFGYRLTENGPVIYSRSENGLDDGGIHSPRWDSEPVPTSAGADGTSDDFVFWPPKPR
jgi:hypothetical protein